MGKENISCEEHSRLNGCHHSSAGYLQHCRNSHAIRAAAHRFDAVLNAAPTGPLTPRRAAIRGPVMLIARTQNVRAAAESR
ncbi:hypothetical protein KCP76_13505 [Salmonella enterica subsp. enterica serovar Weltevreden]|nr:hypothetical protein KCP76_13505 [Salmonella enterica subsp. enterica serovar Weltevreden]